MSKNNTPKLRFPEFTDEWRKTNLEKISDKISDGIHSTPKYQNESEFFFINGNNLINKKIIFNKDTKAVFEEEYKKYKKN